MVVVSLLAEGARDWVQAWGMAGPGLLCGRLYGPRPQLVSPHSLSLAGVTQSGARSRYRNLATSSFEALRNYIHFIFIQKI